MLEQAGLVSRSPENPQMLRERFRGRLLFPIHDARGRTVGFGGRILPELEQKMADAGRGVAKYLNSPETLLFKKSRNLYGADLARLAARNAGWVGVVEGYTDVIAAHQVGLANVVGTLGTALTDDHVQALRRLADRVVLVFDGDEAGQKAADRSLELFLSHEVDVRVLALPDLPRPLRLPPGPWRRAVPGNGRPRRRPAHLCHRPGLRPLRPGLARGVAAGVGAGPGDPGCQGADAVVPRWEIDVEVSPRRSTPSPAAIRVPVPMLNRRLRELHTQANRRSQPSADPAQPDEKPRPIAVSALDPVDLELIRILLDEPSVASRLITRVAPAMLRDAPLRAILQACYDVYGEGQAPGLDLVMARLDDPAVRDLAAALPAPMESAPIKSGVDQAPVEVRLAMALAALADRERQGRIRDLRAALAEVDPATSPDEYRAIRLEIEKTFHQRPDTRRPHAS